MTARGSDISLILANAGCLMLMGGCLGAVGLAGYQIHVDNLREEHIALTKKAFTDKGLEFWNPARARREIVLNLNSAEHYFRLLDLASVEESLRFLSQIGYQDLEEHRFKVGAHIVVGSVNETVRANLANGVYHQK